MTPANLAYLSNLAGIGGSIKQQPDRFVVEEITSNGDVLEVDKRFDSLPASSASSDSKDGSAKQEQNSKFTHFILQKTGWGTLDALRTIGKQLGCGMKRFSYAGMKDRNALTTQLCGAFAIPPSRLLSVHIKDISITGAWPATDKVRMGELGGNRFTIIVDGVSSDISGQINAIASSLNNKFPNYFGEQRFGMRGNTHEIGLHIVKGNLEDAVLAYICAIGEEENQEAKEARLRLAQERDFAAALKYFPQHLRYERTLIEHISRNPRDFANALRKLPRGISLIFIHACQAHIFNLALSERIRNGEITAESSPTETGNLVGYESKPTEFENTILQQLSIAPENFKLKPLPELSSKGTTRALLCELKNFSFEQMNGTDGDVSGDASGSEASGKFRFALMPGAYATTALREFLEKKN